MKKSIIFVVLMLVVSVAHASVFVVIDKETKRVVTMGQQDDNVINDNQEIKVLPGKLKNYDLKYNPVFYDYKDDIFVVNTERLDAAYKQEEENKEKSEELRLLNEEMIDMAIERLEAKDVKLKHFKKKEN